MNILILEDDESTLFALAQAFEQFDVKPLKAHTCQEANDMLTFENIDVALVDYWMNGGTCEAVAERMRSMGIPYVMMTAAFHPEKLAERIQARHFIKKPFDLETLFALVLEAVHDKHHPPALDR